MIVVNEDMKEEIKKKVKERVEIWDGEKWINDYEYAYLYHTIRIGEKEKEEYINQVKSIKEEGLKPSSLDPALYPSSPIDQGVFLTATNNYDDHYIGGVTIRVKVKTEDLYVDVLSEMHELNEYFLKNEDILSNAYGELADEATLPEDVGITEVLGERTGHVVVPLQHNYDVVYEDIGDELYEWLSVIYPYEIKPLDIKVIVGMSQVEEDLDRW